ncbi:MAG: hypothetical protein H0W76_04375 [Pyrinomonadaceae bacterium]|nr:hypothetical protein [Pyrinomonadaceae bacterium]
MKPEIQENLMHRYLLGDLPESETTRLEAEFLTDDERFEQMWEIENRLVDSYVRGRLSSEDRESLERHYLASPVHRRRVALARNLIERADGSSAKAIATEPKYSWWTRLSEKLEISLAPWQFALTAAMLLLAASSLWFFIDRTRLHHELARLKAESEARQSREQAMADLIAAARGQSEKLIIELERLRAEGNAIAQQPTPPAPAQAPRPSSFSFLLSPMLMRSGGDPQTLTIPLKTDLVRLRMKVEGEDARRFRVSVRTVEGRQIWNRQTVKPRIDGANGAVITVHIPAGKLILGDYILTLSSVKSTGDPEEVNRYFFRVIKR